jgi:uncharacterized protein (UPF0332 family)
MKPQTGAFLDKVRELLDQADTIADVGLNELAGRTAYLAAVHAAQTLIFENTDEIVTSHKGVQGEFWRLTKDEPRVDEELRAFLPRAYRFKRIIDYKTGFGSHTSAPKLRVTPLRLRAGSWIASRPLFRRTVTRRTCQICRKP